MNNNYNVKEIKRYNIIVAIVYVIGIILLVGLFNLQVIKGREYREISNNKLTRDSTIIASRGNILDRTGNNLAGNSTSYNLQLYKSKIEPQVLNETLYKVITVLEQNGDNYLDNFPINLECTDFLIKDKELEKWKKTYKLDENAGVNEALIYFINRYEISNMPEGTNIRKLIGIRYEIDRNGYSMIRSATIAKNISRTSALQFNERNEEFPGIAIVISPTRIYQEGNLASHIIGYVGKINQNELEANKEENYSLNDQIGKTGIEYVFEKYLRGVDGVKHIDMSVDGTITDESIGQEAVSGCDVVLTVDKNLQKVAEEALKNNIERIASGVFGKKTDCKTGAVVVTNVKTGEILAMASYPDYNPNDFTNGISSEKWNEYNNPLRPLFNRAIQGEYAPGSTFKMVTAIAALESGAIDTKEKVNDVGVYPLSYKPVCWLWTQSHIGHGYLNVSDAIKHSCNYFFYEMGNRMGIDTLEKYGTYLGLGGKTGIELPSEANGTLARRAIVENNGGTWYLADTLSASIGQSYNNFTPIQMAKYTSMIANGGKPIDLTLIKSIIDINGKEVDKKDINEYVNKKLGLEEESTEDLSFKEENIKAVLKGMKSVTSDTGGTAYSVFKGFNIEVGGKTGSAEANTKTNGWFVGFAPFDEPEISVVVIVENAGHGSYTAEVARDIIAQYYGMNTTVINENMEAIPEIEMQR